MMKIYFAGGNGGGSEKIEFRYQLNGIKKRLYSYHYLRAVLVIIKTKK